MWSNVKFFPLKWTSLTTRVHFNWDEKSIFLTFMHPRRGRCEITRIYILTSTRQPPNETGIRSFREIIETMLEKRENLRDLIGFNVILAFISIYFKHKVQKETFNREFTRVRRNYPARY